MGVIENAKSGPDYATTSKTTTKAEVADGDDEEEALTDIEATAGETVEMDSNEYVDAFELPLFPIHSC